MAKASEHSFFLQTRDFALLGGLFESRVMTIAHIAALYFEGSREAAKKRLQKVKAAGLINERKRRVNEPSVLFLTRKGFSLLSAENLLAEFPRLSASAFEKRAAVSDLTIRHELEVMDVKAAFYAALRKSEAFSIAEFATWPRLHEFRASRPGNDRSEVLVKPDGFIRIHEREKDGGFSEHTFFLEVDRSTESQDTLANRAACYLNYYQSGGFALRNGASRVDYKEFPFRVLFVLKNAERRNNTAERLISFNPPIRTMAFLATFSEVLAEPTGQIWIRPVDYSRALVALAAANSPSGGASHARLKRQLVVQDTIGKLPLLETT